MDTIAIAIISPQDYPSFRSVLGADLPDTYDEWLDLVREYERELVKHGTSYVRIEVDPKEYARFCYSRQIGCNRASLGDFATEKAAGRSY